MKWQIPAKTFLLGEYAALENGSAIILTTSPCFSMSLSLTGMQSIHPDSPAGRWWRMQSGFEQGLDWFDPYQGKGGLGASSAQFLGAYMASSYLLKNPLALSSMLAVYYHCAWQGQGLRPSGYDVLSQSQQGCVYINRQKTLIQCYEWPFSDIDFLLVHTGQKLATHTHLQTLKQPEAWEQLSTLVDEGRDAFEGCNSEKLIAIINAYQEKLTAYHLSTEYSREQITRLRSMQHILAAKGCGAMGADVLLLIVPKTETARQAKMLATSGWHILASNQDLYKGPALIKNYT